MVALSREKKENIDGIIEELNEEISTFFACEPIEFTLDFDPKFIGNRKSSFADEDINAQFHCKNEKNMITFGDSNIKKNTLRHEMVHGYHIRKNSTVSSLKNYIESMMLFLNQTLSFETTNPKVNEILFPTIIRSGNRIIASTIYLESLAHAYTLFKEESNIKLETTRMIVAEKQENTHFFRNIYREKQQKDHLTFGISFDNIGEFSQIIDHMISNSCNEKELRYLRENEVRDYITKKRLKSYVSSIDIGEYLLFHDICSNCSYSHEEDFDLEIRKLPKFGETVLVTGSFQKLSPEKIAENLKQLFYQHWEDASSYLIEKNNNYYKHILAEIDRWIPTSLRSARTQAR